MRIVSAIIVCLSTINLFGQDHPDLLRIVNELGAIEQSFRTAGARGGHPDTYSFRNFESFINETDKKRPYIEQVVAIPNEKLSITDKINKEVLLLQLRDEIAYVDYKRYLVPMNAEGGFYNSPTYMIPRLPFNTYQDYQDYLGWLPSYSDYLDYQLDLLKMGVKEGIMPPKIVVSNNVGLMEPWTQTDNLNSNPFYAPLLRFPESFSADQQAQLQKNAELILTETIIPKYQEVREFLEKKYMKAAPERPGIINIDGGKEFYEDRIRHFTTLEMTPDSVFELGVSEVKRIRQLMKGIIKQVEFDGTFADFIDFLRTDEQFYPKTGQELLNYASWLSKKAEGQLPPLFGELYTLPFTVEPVPDAIAPNYTGGRYVPGSRSRNKAGIYWVNTSKLKSRTLYTIPALTLHEAVPGHHLQITMASEIEDVPDFRNNYYISAFGEGWGLYSEFLGEEMGMYETPYYLFGRYTYEMWRACRLVVDVGIHYKDWSRDEALRYLSENTALSMHEVTTEIDRYIGWPGQAVSYKVGEIMIKNLRSIAEKELGDQFDIQQFHKIVLENGSVPLTILQEQVNSYIKDSKQ